MPADPILEQLNTLGPAVDEAGAWSRDLLERADKAIKAGNMEEADDLMEAERDFRVEHGMSMLRQLVELRSLGLANGFAGTSAMASLERLATNYLKYVDKAVGDSDSDSEEEDEEAR